MRALPPSSAFFAFALSLSPLAAQTPGPAGVALPARAVTKASLTVRVEVQDSVVSTQIEQVLRNRGSNVAEADWLLPLPEGAVADGFTMTVGDQTLAGEVLDAARARSVYEAIVRRRRDPGLLEYFGHGCLRARVFPIPAQGEVVVRVRYRHVLPALDGTYEYALPLRAFAAGDLPPERCTVELTIRSAQKLANVYAPRADVDVRMTSDHLARATFEGGLPELRARDLQVFYGLADGDFGLRAFSFARPGEDGYFAVLLSPKRDWGEAQRMPRCVQFVLDTSGSMGGRKLEQAKGALRYFLRELHPGDSFNVIPFATEAAPIFECPAPVSTLSLDAALRRIDALVARGATNIDDALGCALRGATLTYDGPSPLPIVVFLTDGEPTVGETDRERLLARARQLNAARARVFVFGVGDTLDARLLDRLASESGGSRNYVREHEDIAVKTAALFTKLSNPVLSDATLELRGLEVYDVQPKRLPDVFLGTQIVVSGRYRNSGKLAARLRGRMTDQACDCAQTFTFPAEATAYDFVPTLWAQRQVDYLLDEIHQRGRKQELVDEVQRLARQYGVVTPFTSHLIVEESVRLGAIAPPGGARVGAGTPGPGGPSTPGPSGPATGGPGAAASGPRTSRDRLGSLGSASGAGAVADSRDLRVTTGSEDFYLGGVRREDLGAPSSRGASVATRRVGARTFYGVGDRWVDVACSADWHKRAEVVLCYSEAYFALLAQHPELRAVFALGERVVVQVGERVIEVKPGA